MVEQSRQILHVDMDAFFASVEQLDDPALRGKPVVVGGRSRRSVVCAASYEARPFGVRSAMPMGEALRRCPDAIVVEPRRDRYEEVSRQTFDVFYKYTPLVEGLSLDEAFLDVTKSQALFGTGHEIAELVRADIRAVTGLTASAGVATTKFVAKIASDMNKPDGVTVAPLEPEAVAEFLAPLPISRMWGVGPKQEPRFLALGLRTFRDLQRADARWLVAALGPDAERLQALARGHDLRSVEPSREAKSIGGEQTYEADLQTPEDVERELLAHAERIAQRLVAGQLFARQISIKLKHADFSIVTRQTQLEEPARNTHSIYQAACSLFRAWHAATDHARFRLRLVGVAAAGLSTHGAGLLFPDARRERHDALEAVLRAVSHKTGTRVTRAGLLGDPNRGRR